MELRLDLEMVRFTLNHLGGRVYSLEPLKAEVFSDLSQKDGAAEEPGEMKPGRDSTHC